MTAFSTFLDEIRGWANRPDWDDVLVTSFVRGAESKLNESLRIDRMIRVVANTVTCRCADLPGDWLEMDFVEIACEGSDSGFRPIRYKSRDEFFSLSDQNALGYYTIKGRTIFFGGTPDDTEGVEFHLTYYGEVPVFADDVDSWVYTKFSSLYRYASLTHSDLYAVGEEEKALGLNTLVDSMIAKLNQAHLLSKASGSRVTRTRVRSFG